MSANPHRFQLGRLMRVLMGVIGIERQKAALLSQDIALQEAALRAELANKVGLGQQVHELATRVLQEVRNGEAAQTHNGAPH